MKTLWIILCLALLQAAAQGQLPPQLTWVSYFQPVKPTGISIDGASGFYQSRMASDGYGNHYVTVYNNQVVYYLLDNSGNELRSTTFGANTLHPSITSFYDPNPGGQLTREHIVLQQGSNLVLYRSGDGGVSWTALPTQPIQGSLVSIDSYEDLTGIHITYGSSTGIYYLLRNRTPDGWDNRNPFVAAISPPPPPYSYFNLPSVIATSESSHIYTQQGFYSRQLNENTWTGAQALVLNANWPATLTITREQNGVEYIHAFIWGETNPNYPFYGGVTSTRRKLFGSTGWDPAPPLNETVEGGYTGWKPQCNSAGSLFRWVFNLVDLTPFVPNSIYSDQDGGYLTLNLIAGTSRTPAITSDITGVAVVWWDLTTGTAFMRRRPLGVSDASTGSIVDNYSFTDTTWITGTLTLSAGKQLRLKSGSVTRRDNSEWRGRNDNSRRFSSGRRWLDGFPWHE